MIVVMYSNFLPSAAHLAVLRAQGGGRKVQVVNSEAEAIVHAAQAEIILGHRYLRQVLPHAVNVRWVQSTAAGINLLKAPELIARDITLCRCPVNSVSVAHHALAMGWALLRDLPSAVAAQGRGEYSAPRPALPLPSTALVLGLGVIGQQLARLLRGLGLHVTGVARRGTLDQRKSCDRFLFAEHFREALPATDLFFLALPLDVETRGLIGGSELASLPNHAVLVSVTRSAVFDLEALLVALRAGRLGGAALDGLDPVPLQHSDFWTTPRLLVTPKLAAYHAGMQQQIERYVEDQLRRYLSGCSPLRNRVSKDTLQTSFDATR